VLLYFSAFGTPACALENENLLVAMPPGYKVGFHEKTGASMMSEQTRSSKGCQQNGVN
jgi:hypothetical protein